jgi:hypothetical protein
MLFIALYLLPSHPLVKWGVCFSLFCIPWFDPSIQHYYAFLIFLHFMP